MFLHLFSQYRPYLFSWTLKWSTYQATGYKCDLAGLGSGLYCAGWSYGSVIGSPTFCARVLGWVPAAPLPIQLPANAPLWRQWGMVEYASTMPCGRPKLESPIPAFVLTHPDCCEHWGNEPKDERSLSLSIFLCYPVFQLRKIKNKQKSSSITSPI